MTSTQDNRRHMEEQKAREFGRLAEALAVLARKRQSAAGKARHGQLPKNFTEAESGEAKAQAASHVGLSRPTAEKAAEVPMTATPCPACNSTETRPELGDRHQCRNCGWRFIVRDDGTTADWLGSWKTAGRGRRKSRCDRREARCK